MTLDAYLAEALPLKNLTLSDLIKLTDGGRLSRAAYVKTNLLKVTKTGTYLFTTKTVGNNPDKVYKTSIGFKSGQRPGLNVPPVISCSCPDFKYRLHYVINLYDALYGRRDPIASKVPPVVRNASLKPYLCKHLYAGAKMLATKKILT